jgi:hypothetical protein
MRSDNLAKSYPTLELANIELQPNEEFKEDLIEDH